MSDEAKESKAQKLAAARKKLKEYQKRGAEHTTTPSAATMHTGDVAISSNVSITSTQDHHSNYAGSISSNLSEHSDSELNLNGGSFVMVTESGGVSSAAATPPPQLPSTTPILAENSASMSDKANAPASSASTAASYFTTLPPSGNSVETFFHSISPVLPTGEQQQQHQQNQNTSEDSQQDLKAIQVLIVEKAQLTADLTKYRAACREKDLHLDELRIQYSNTTQQLEDLQQRLLYQQQTMEHWLNTNVELQHKLAQETAGKQDQSAHLEELRKQLNVAQTVTADLEASLKQKDKKLELAEIRVRQLSDEGSSSQDGRLENLMQTKLIYEQQIRDLQAMVQQLNQDKEQANNQYQNYVQHLNAEVNRLNERNAELNDESTKLQERERQLVEHISGLEREIQRNISRQDQLRDKEDKKEEFTNTPTSEVVAKIAKLEEKISDFDFERHEFQLKIKSQENRLEQLKGELQQKQNELELAQGRLEQLTAEQPDTTKLLATMESDKVAASRAMIQNVELKQQLDELETRFVQLTNDKADLMNKLDAEEYVNREMRTNYVDMAERLNVLDERFKFKDEEMIRLSHENMELKQQLARLRTNEGEREEEIEQDLQSHAYHDHDHDHGHSHGHLHFHDHNDHVHDHHNHDHTHSHVHVGEKYCYNHANEQHDQSHHSHDSRRHEEGDHEHKSKPKDQCYDTQGTAIEVCQEADEAITDINKGKDLIQFDANEPQHTPDFAHRSLSTSTPHIATKEAVEKLQQRFTKLMAQVADLTDEKQRLEHLVLQLQGETETIGEYVTLYQTQRRMLKQREYEKAAQMQHLQEEREQLREKIAILTTLVSSLGVELPQDSSELIQANQEYLPTTTDKDSKSDSRSMQDHLNAALNTENTIEGIREQNELKHQHLPDAALVDKLNSTETQQIITKIQNIISEIKENAKEVPTASTVDHLNCCSGKFEVV